MTNINLYTKRIVSFALYLHGNLDFGFRISDFGFAVDRWQAGRLPHKGSGLFCGAAVPAAIRRTTDSSFQHARQAGRLPHKGSGSPFGASKRRGAVPLHFPGTRSPTVVVTHGVNSTVDKFQSASNALFHSYLSESRGVPGILSRQQLPGAHARRRTWKRAGPRALAR